VESGQVLQNMLSAILRNPKQTSTYAKRASDQITQILNS
jgi:hypothetical protein